MRKIDAGDGSYPSVNTCVHYLKLPDYSSEEVMREKLQEALLIIGEIPSDPVDKIRIKQPKKNV